MHTMPRSGSGCRPRATIISSVTVASLHLCSPNYAASIFHWVDEQGNTHYSDRAISGRQTEQLDAAKLGRINLQQGVAIEPRSTRERSSQRTIARTGKRQSKLDKACQRYRTNILGLEQKLRQGYSEPAGSKLRRRKQKWSDLLYRQCF
mgnify:CR=1 FL=1